MVTENSAGDGIIVNMTYQRIGRSLIWLGALVLLLIIALGAKWLPPMPPIVTAPTAAELYQQKLEVAERVCEKAKIIAAGSEPAITLEECLEENARCENKLGLHAIWTGPAPGGFPTCTCEEGYKWVNDDETTGVSYGTVVLNLAGGSGRCVERQ